MMGRAELSARRHVGVKVRFFDECAGGDPDDRQMSSRDLPLNRRRGNTERLADFRQVDEAREGV